MSNCEWNWEVLKERAEKATGLKHGPGEMWLACRDGRLHHVSCNSFAGSTCSCESAVVLFHADPNAVLALLARAVDAERERDELREEVARLQKSRDEWAADAEELRAEVERLRAALYEYESPATCFIEPTSSRACEHGTRGCVVSHIVRPAQAKDNQGDPGT